MNIVLELFKINKQQKSPTLSHTTYIHLVLNSLCRAQLHINYRLQIRSSIYTSPHFNWMSAMTSPTTDFFGRWGLTSLSLSFVSQTQAGFNSCSSAFTCNKSYWQVQTTWKASKYFRKPCNLGWRSGSLTYWCLS